MPQPMQYDVGGRSLEGELPSTAPGSWGEVGENCPPLEPCEEGSDMGATAEHGLCPQTFLLRLRLAHRYAEFNMTYIEL